MYVFPLVMQHIDQHRSPRYFARYVVCLFHTRSKHHADDRTRKTRENCSWLCNCRLRSSHWPLTPRTDVNMRIHCCRGSKHVIAEERTGPSPPAAPCFTVQNWELPSAVYTPAPTAPYPNSGNTVPLVVEVIGEDHHSRLSPWQSSYPSALSSTHTHWPTEAAVALYAHTKDSFLKYYLKYIIWKAILNLRQEV